MAAREAKKALAARDDAGALAVFSAQRAAATASSAAPTAASAAGTAAAGSEKGDDPSVASSDLSCSMPVGWKRYAASASGRPYFFNPNTGGMREPPVLRYALDDGRVYYYDPATQRTSWVEPEGVHAWQEPRTQKERRAADDDADEGAAAAAAAVAAAALHDDAAARMAAREARARAVPRPPPRRRRPSTAARRLACRSRRRRRRRRRRAARRARRRAWDARAAFSAAEHLRVGGDEPAAALAGGRERRRPGGGFGGGAARRAADDPRPRHWALGALEHADMLWQPMLVRDLDSTCCCLFSPDASGASQVLLNPPDERLRFLSCQLEQGDAAAAPRARRVSAAPHRVAAARAPLRRVPP